MGNEVVYVQVGQSFGLHFVIMNGYCSSSMTDLVRGVAT